MYTTQTLSSPILNNFLHHLLSLETFDYVLQPSINVANSFEEGIEEARNVRQRWRRYIQSDHEVVHQLLMHKYFDEYVIFQIYFFPNPILEAQTFVLAYSRELDKSLSIFRTTYGCKSLVYGTPPDALEESFRPCVSSC